MQRQKQQKESQRCVAENKTDQVVFLFPMSKISILLWHEDEVARSCWGLSRAGRGALQLWRWQGC
eukprot:4113041-Ditylum_brightwellii.AAC.1